jgi:hypothetical protein
MPELQGLGKVVRTARARFGGDLVPSPSMTFPARLAGRR